MDHHHFLKASLSQSPVVVLCTNLKRNVAILTERQFSTLKVLDLFLRFYTAFFHTSTQYKRATNQRALFQKQFYPTKC